jgi:hypothetical protein
VAAADGGGAPCAPRALIGTVLVLEAAHAGASLATTCRRKSIEGGANGGGGGANGAAMQREGSDTSLVRTESESSADGTGGTGLQVLADSACHHSVTTVSPPCHHRVTTVSPPGCRCWPTRSACFSASAAYAEITADIVSLRGF